MSNDDKTGLLFQADQEHVTFSYEDVRRSFNISVDNPTDLSQHPDFEKVKLGIVGAYAFLEGMQIVNFISYPDCWSDEGVLFSQFETVDNRRFNMFAVRTMAFNASYLEWVVREDFGFNRHGVVATFDNRDVYKFGKYIQDNDEDGIIRPIMEEKLYAISHFLVTYVNHE